MTDATLHNPQLDGAPFLLEAGPTGVLLVHGFTATPVEVRRLADRLHAAGFTVAGPLMAGHGTRPEDLNETRWQDWVWSVEQVYHELATRCERVIIGGESTGALVALYLASKDPDITAVLCYAPAIKLQASRADLFRLYLAAPFIAAVPKESLDVDTRWQGYPVNPLKGAVQLLAFEKEVEARLPRIEQPVLVVQGRQDTTIAPESRDIILGAVASEIKEFHMMEHSTHVVLLDDELDAVTDLTLAFIERALQAGSASRPRP